MTTAATVSGLEAVADAIMQFEGWFRHDRGIPSASYRNRNPGNLESNGVKRQYTSLIDGYTELLHDLRQKFTGHNSHGLGPTSHMMDLFAVYAPAGDGNPVLSYCSFVCHWVTMVTGKAVTPSTSLKDVWSP